MGEMYKPKNILFKLIFDSTPLRSRMDVTQSEGDLSDFNQSEH